MSSLPMDVDITVISAKHLKNVNWRNGDLIPYAVVYLSPTHRISTKPDFSGSTRPVWNERFLLPLPDSPISHFLSLDIFHSDIPIGSTRVPIPGLEDPTRIQTFELVRPSGRPQGKIRIKLARIPRFTPNVSDSHTPFTPLANVPPPPPPQQSYTSPLPVQEYNLTPPVSNCYNSYPRPNPLAPPQPPQKSYTLPRPVRDFNLTPTASHNYNLTPHFPCPLQPKQSYTPPPPVRDFNDYDSATTPNYPPPRPLPPQQCYSYSSYYEPYYQSYYPPKVSHRPGLDRQQSYNGERTAPMDYNAPYDENKMKGFDGAMGRLKLEENDLGSTSDYSEYRGSYSGRPSAPVDYEGRFDGNRMTERENEGHKADNDYGEYRRSYGYN